MHIIIIILVHYTMRCSSILQFSKIPFLELIKVMYEYFIFVGSLKRSDYVILEYSSKETIVLFHKLG